MRFLSLENVSHYYFSKTGYTKALENVSLEIEEGEFVSIIGSSGCGKSTILSIIARLMKQTEGEIKLQNDSLTESELKIGYMLQQDYLFPWKTIIDNILLGPKIAQNINEKTIDQAKQLLAEVELGHTENLYPSELSGGMRQRIALVRTLITNPDILLFDEPFSALDYVTKLRLENLVAKMMKTYHKTAILVTHDLAEAISMSDRIFLMAATPGRIIKTFVIPDEIRKEVPFYVRRHPLYQPLFDEIWEYVNKLDEAEQGVDTHEGND